MTSSPASQSFSAAIVTVGSELVEGLRIDTNTAEVARDIGPYGFRVAEALSVGDGADVLASALARLCRSYQLIVVTGGLGPTHDDVTREAAAAALGLPMIPDAGLLAFLQPFLTRHSDPASAEQVLTQALVLEGAEILSPTNGTAAGQLVPTPAGQLLLLPGPPREMRPMLARFLERRQRVRAQARELGVTGMPESDVQHAAQRGLAGTRGIVLTVLAKPGDCKVLLIDDGAGDAALDAAVIAVAAELGDACYSTDGVSLAQSVLRAADAARLSLATAESCTGGLVAAALTDIPGSSTSFMGGVVSYSNAAKHDILGVPGNDLESYGAVSEEVARAMARGARAKLRADVAVAITGVAGPGGGTPTKPVGLVWFALDSARLAEPQTVKVEWSNTSREAVRARATALALNLLRLELLRP